MDDREQIARDLAVAFHGDEVEWRAFLTKADTVLARKRSEVVVHVVMGNDFPDAVFTTLAAAEAYCETKRKEGPFNPSGSSRIYWKVYDFVLRT